MNSHWISENRGCGLKLQTHLRKSFLLLDVNTAVWHNTKSFFVVHTTTAKQFLLMMLIMLLMSLTLSVKFYSTNSISDNV